MRFDMWWLNRRKVLYAKALAYEELIYELDGLEDDARFWHIRAVDQGARAEKLRGLLIAERARPF